MRAKSLRVWLTLLLFCLSLLGGCRAHSSSSPQVNSQGSGETIIATSFYPVYIMTLNIAKNIPDVRVVNMTKPTTGCLHDYAATPEDMKNLEGAQFLVVNGAGMESFLDKVASQRPDLKLIDASKGIPLIKDKTTGANPHVWVSISGAIAQVQNIGSQLAALDPAHADMYRKNTETYLGKLEAEQARMHKALDGLPNRDIITFHEAFPYFAREFGLNIVGVVQREPGSEPSARELDETIQLIKSLRVKTILVEPQYPDRTARVIARETGARIYTLDPAVTGPDDADAYIKIMDKNLEVLKEALR